MTKLLRAAVTAAAISAFGVGAAAAQTKTLDVIVFPGGFNWPIFVGQDKGFFEKSGVTVKVTPTPNSQFQLKGLIEGKFDIAMTAMDNVIAYSEGQGATKTEVEPDIFAFMGGDKGFLRLVAVPEVKTTADLKGKQISVDALTTGYAFVLRKLLENAGLKHEDVAVRQRRRRPRALHRADGEEACGDAADLAVRCGRGSQGLQSPRQCRRGARSLSGAWSAPPAADGRRRTRRICSGYIRGYTRVARLAVRSRQQGRSDRDPAQARARHVGRAATRSYDILVHPTKGFTRGAVLDVEGVKTVLQLRSQYTGKQLTDPAKYFDLSYFDKAKIELT